MTFLLMVNGRTLSPQSFCALCCERSASYENLQHGCLTAITSATPTIAKRAQDRLSQQRHPSLRVGWSGQDEAGGLERLSFDLPSMVLFSCEREAIKWTLGKLNSLRPKKSSVNSALNFEGYRREWGSNFLQNRFTAVVSLGHKCHHSDPPVLLT